MGVSFSSYYDLVRLRELGPEAKDWASTDKNFEVISQLLKAFENHVHTGTPGMVPPSIPVSIAVGTPTVITLNNHGYVAGQTVYFFTNGWLPTGMSPGIIYYVSPNNITTNTFKITTIQGSTVNDVNTSGTQGGQQTVALQPVLTEVATGGSLAPGTTIGVRLSYLNAQGLETQATIEKDITLTPAATRPLAPSLTSVTAQAGALSGGNYMYVMTKVKGTGETDASDALGVAVPFDQTYQVVINFDAISSYTDGTTQYNIYRSAGLNSSFQLVGVITDANATAFTDLNVSVDQTAQPPSTSTFDSTKSLTIDWSKIGGAYPSGATALNIYVTQQPGVWSNTHLLSSISLTGTPPTTLTYLGSETLNTGYPYDYTQIPNMPPPIDSSQMASGAGGGSAVGEPPIGAVIAWTGSGDPPVVAGAGTYVIADGRLVDRTTYATFFSTTGHKYNLGTDPGGNSVRIPDKRGKKSIGALNMGTTAQVADNGHYNAAQGYSYGTVSETLSAAQLPPHYHNVNLNTDGNHSDHTHTSGGQGDFATTDGSLFEGNVWNNPQAGHTPGLYANHASAVTATLGSSNSHIHNTSGGTDNGSGLSGSSHNNIDPCQADSYLVRIA